MIIDSKLKGKATEKVAIFLLKDSKSTIHDTNELCKISFARMSQSQFKMIILGK